MSKAGTEAFVRSTAVEQEREAHPFHLVNVSPGVIDTEMQGSIRASSVEDFPSIDRFVGLKQSGALQTPQHVASIIARIADDNFANGSRVEAALYKPA
jgi:NAD(P)-dependent dehydrogenase (short-subunit alcohol dehydrogenase family)